jgi:hypothetical protein
MGLKFVEKQSKKTLDKKDDIYVVLVNDNYLAKLPTGLAEYSSTVDVLRIVCMSDYVRYGIQFLALAAL